MTRGIKYTNFDRGVQPVHVSSWRAFTEWATYQLAKFGYIWRGQHQPGWKLESSLERSLTKLSLSGSSAAIQKHLNAFQMACRGRRGDNPQNLQNDNEWWALGQHHGLATPLLDWTTSPFVAAFFAYEHVPEKSQRYCAVYSLSKASITRHCNVLKRTAAKAGNPTPQVIDFVEPMSDENPRLVSQGGLFTRAPDGMDVETWVAGNYSGSKGGIWLHKVILPMKDREIALRALDKMNINHLSLFPDLEGASKFCNIALTVKSSK